MRDPEWFGSVALVAALLVVLVGGAALMSQAPSGASTTPSAASGAPTVGYLNLTIVINATNGLPQYTPANFSVPRGEVKVTIIDQDLAEAWSTCPCLVTGTVGNSESVNGSLPVSSVPTFNVAHTFTVPSLGVNVYSPGGSTVSFTLSLNQAGQFDWFCEAPCGSDGLTGAPMGIPGFMAGTLSVY